MGANRGSRDGILLSVSSRSNSMSISSWPACVHNRSRLLAGLVVTRRHLEFLDVFGRQLRAIHFQRDLAEFAREGERALIVLIVHRRAGVGADVEALVPLHDERERLLHLLGHDFLAVHLEHACAAPPDTAHVVESQRASAEALILEVELNRMLARR